jgi:hypothetical protein
MLKCYYTNLYYTYIIVIEIAQIVKKLKFQLLADPIKLGSYCTLDNSKIRKTCKPQPKSNPNTFWTRRHMRKKGFPPPSQFFHGRMSCASKQIVPFLKIYSGDCWKETKSRSVVNVLDLFAKMEKVNLSFRRFPHLDRILNMFCSIKAS